MLEKNSSGVAEHYQSMVSRYERKLVYAMVDKVPKGIETYHLTLSTILWSLLIVLFGYLATFNIHWLWGSAVGVALQYITDLLDGAIGRKRNTGLIKWGFYMDHFLDYIFMCSVVISFWFVLPDKYNLFLFFLLAILGAYLVDAYLRFAATGNLKIAHLGFGPTEARIAFIIIYVLNILGNRTFLSTLIPYIFLFVFGGLCYVVYKNQKEIWELDMRIKAEQEGDNQESNKTKKQEDKN